MSEYKIIKRIIDLVYYENKNLNDLINQYKEDENIVKIRYIVYDLLRYSTSIDYILSKLVRNIDYDVMGILRIGIYELWLSKKPEYAIINDLVNLTKEFDEKKKSFVNAVLRSFQRSKEKFIKDIDNEYSYKYNIPSWLLNYLKKEYKNNYLEIIKSFMYKPSFGLRVNSKKNSYNEYLKLLIENNIEYKEIDSKIVLDKAINVSGIPGFYEGLVSVQDVAAQYMLDILKKHNIEIKNALDICSAPGGKTCQLLENYDCNLTSVDIDENRLKKVKQNLDRLELNCNTILGDANNKRWWNGDKYDFIIADVPCSALGTIKRNPDIKITRRLEEISNFVQTQRSIINNIWELLNLNCYMIYITCSIMKEENQLNVEWLSNNLNGFKIIDELQIYPSENNDGLYYALIKKVG
ncbi:MAG: transcription antitermination factor NusB [Burkholderiales bacterium]|nr:transcription antitermination factor NusB [Burkholderiales bacterium]